MLCCAVNTDTHTLGCTCTSTLLWAIERGNTKGGKRSRRLSDAGFGFIRLLTQAAAHKITVVYCLWKDPLPHSMLPSSGDSSRVKAKSHWGMENWTQCMCVSVCMCMKEIAWMLVVFTLEMYMYCTVLGALILPKLLCCVVCSAGVGSVWRRWGSHLLGLGSHNSHYSSPCVFSFKSNRWFSVFMKYHTFCRCWHAFYPGER